MAVQNYFHHIQIIWWLIPWEKDVSSFLRHFECVYMCLSILVISMDFMFLDFVYWCIYICPCKHRIIISTSWIRQFAGFEKSGDYHCLSPQYPWKCAIWTEYPGFSLLLMYWACPLDFENFLPCKNEQKNYAASETKTVTLPFCTNLYFAQFSINLKLRVWRVIPSETCPQKWHLSNIY